MTWIPRRRKKGVCIPYVQEWPVFRDKIPHLDHRFPFTAPQVETYPPERLGEMLLGIIETARLQYDICEWHREDEKNKELMEEIELTWSEEHQDYI